MSLVGSLEDLGLGDILQIVGLSRKSGLLRLASDRGDGRILLLAGTVLGATVKGEPSDLRDLLLAAGRVDERSFEQAQELAGAEGLSIDEAVSRQCGIPLEALEALRREHVERCVLRMFGWRDGEFRFEIREEFDAEEREQMLPAGLNIQYLAMEATRLDDEQSRHPVPEPVAAPAAELMAPAPPTRETESEASTDAADRAASASTDAADRAASASTDAADRAAPAAPDAYLIAVDADLSTLEWLKASVDGLFRRVHIFQRHENAIDRIRQYVLRGRIPIVVVSRPRPGAREAERSFVSRLRTLSPKLEILTLDAENAAHEAGAGTDGLLIRPASLSSDPDRWHLHQGLADRLRADLASRL